LNKSIAFLDIILRDGQITYASKIKVLGAWINCNLNWDLHAENLLKKLSKHCFAIKTFRPPVNKNELGTKYFAYFQSSLKYGILFWGNLKNFKKIFKLQKRAIRLTANIFNTSCKPYLELKFMALPYIYIYKIPVRINMSLNRFKTNSVIYSYNTRNKYDVFVTGHNAKLFRLLPAMVCSSSTNYPVKL
jgi:hypothetical protein